MPERCRCITIPVVQILLLRKLEKIFCSTFSVKNFVVVILPVLNHTHIIVLLLLAFVPPFQGWKPPFSVNVETFRFTPRLQPLNELEVMCGQDPHNTVVSVEVQK